MRIALALCCILLAPAARAEMYKCKDKNGVVSYSDESRPGCKQVDIQGSPPISGHLESKSGDRAEDEAAFKRRQIERGNAEEAEKRAQADKEKRCVALRSELARLSNGRRVVEKTSESGERIYMDDQVREQKIAQAKADLSGCQ
jgi:sRNA-binding protein